MRELVLVGAGPVGLAAARAAVEEEAVSRVVAVVDPSEEARRRGVALLGGLAHAFLEDLPPQLSVALVAFSSRSKLVAPSIEHLLLLGCHVVTTCEELAHPEEVERGRLQGLAEEASRSVVATGANPGFVMDRLPLLLAGGSRRVRRVEVERRLDTSLRRQPLVAKTGRGLEVEEFRRRVTGGDIGHVGLECSARLLADGLGWEVDDLTLSTDPYIEVGEQVSGQHQRLELRASGGRSIGLELVMAWQLREPLDRIRVDGEPPIEVLVQGGYHGDQGTTARVVKGIQGIDGLAPGFYRPTDLPLWL
ncbi:MAG: hypothetical protein M3N51_06685 [Actinomycetota bacterium]|nr:hypothetical protein [Actinomycetota bacterium]